MLVYIHDVRNALFCYSVQHESALPKPLVRLGLHEIVVMLAGISRFGSVVAETLVKVRLVCFFISCMDNTKKSRRRICSGCKSGAVEGNCRVQWAYLVVRA